MNEALVLALGFVLKETSNNGFGASYEHPGGWRISGPDRYTDWAIFNDNSSQYRHIEPGDDLLAIVYNFGVEASRIKVKETVLDMFRIKA